ncbi:MAG: shikimate dehydrogenase, partial [Verrucomicrobiota bacterium]
TSPHKVAVAEAVDEVEPLAQKIGAVNTILFSEGKTVGFNSDAPGFRQAIREAFSVDLSDLQIMLLGAAGGAGMAATYQCAEERCERLVLVNRTRSKAEALAKELEPSLTKGRFVGPVPRLEVISWEDEEAIGQALDHVDLVVNCTNVGMKRSDPPLLPRNVLQPHHLLFDMVYQPARTTFLKDGEGEGARTGNGLGMLLWQGVISFEYWLNVQPPVEAMRKALQASL